MLILKAEENKKYCIKVAVGYNPAATNFIFMEG
jgi:hypothetical protein